MARTVSWRTFRRRFAWAPGEHVTIIGQTGSGKSELARRLVRDRRFAVVLGTKPVDSTLEGFKRDGFRRIGRWPPASNINQVLLWPRIRTVEDLDRQRDVMRHALESIFVEGAWTVYVDELPYFVGRLQLSDMLELYWLQGRSLSVSLVVATQRPANVPLLAFSQATHIFLARTTDDRDLARLREIGGVEDRAGLAATVRRLPRFGFVHVNARTGRYVVVRAPKPD